MNFTIEPSTNKGLESLIIKDPSNKTSAEILLFGATLISWKVNSIEKIFLSDTAIFNGIKAIRGGIPIVFPQFGQPKKEMNQHGFARNSLWDVQSTNTTDNYGEIVFVLNDNESTRSLWPHRFILEYKVFLTLEGLSTELIAKNCGSESFDCQMLLHTYYKIDDINQIAVEGFTGSSCKNQLTSEVIVENSVVNKISEEVDKIYMENNSNQSIGDILLSNTGHGNINISKKAYKSDIMSKIVVPVDVVFWNPWIEKAKSLADLPDEAYHNFVCIEPGTVQDWVRLDPEQSLSLIQQIRTV